VDWEQKRPRVNTLVEVVERPSVTDQLVGIRQDLVRLSNLTLVAIMSVPVLLRHDGVDVVISYLIKDVIEIRRGAPDDLFQRKPMSRGGCWCPRPYRRRF